MKAFYGSRISENMTKTPEGFLICFNVPIARTGWYEYLASEVGLQGNNIVKVYRSPEEVFSKKAIASFEGKIVTDNHPPELLTPETSELYTRGAIQNVRQSQNEPDLLLADLIIYNQRLIEEVENKGKREVSCGYEYILIPNEDGTYSQTNIIGNHVAVVDSGRAGDRVAIMDSKIQKMEGEKRKMSKVRIPRKQRGPVTNLFAAMGLKHFAQDAEPDEIAEAVDALAEERESCDEDVTEQNKVNASDEGGNPEVNALAAKVDKLTELVTQLVNNKAADEEKPEDAIDSLISELSQGEKSTGDEEESMTIPVEEMDEDIPEGHIISPEDRTENPIAGADSAAMIRALNAIKPVIANIKDPVAKKVACDSLIKEFKKANKLPAKSNNYVQIMKAQKQKAVNQQKASDAKANETARLEELHRKRNAQYKKEEK